MGACFPAPHSGLSEGPVDIVSVGRPVPGMEIRLREPDSSGRGHLDIRGRWLLDEYITADGRVQPRDDDGWFRTSDVAVRKGDDLFVIGRSDEVVISRGANVYAEDLEGLAIRIVGDEGFVAAAFRPSIEAQSFVVIVELALRHPNAPDTLAADVRSAIVGNLGVEVEEVLVCKPRTLPLTTSGKVRRSECRNLFADGDWPGKRAVGRAATAPVARAS